MCYLGSIVARPKLKGIGGGVLQRVTRTVRHRIISRTQIELYAGRSEYPTLLEIVKICWVQIISRKDEKIM